MWSISVKHENHLKLFLTLYDIFAVEFCSLTHLCPVITGHGKALYCCGGPQTKYPFKLEDVRYLRYDRPNPFDW